MPGVRRRRHRLRRHRLEIRECRRLRASGKIAVLIDHYDDNWALLKGVLLRCDAQPVEGEERDRAWDLIRDKFPQYKSVAWEPRLTLALRIYDWRQWGITQPSQYEPE